MDGLTESASGKVILTGAPADRNLVEQVAAKCRTTPHLLIGEVGLRGFAAVIEKLDLFITGDTGPMHLADAVGSRGVAIFGPSDPRRYRPEHSDYRTVVRKEVYCSPCNMIRKPPKECSRPEAAECIAGISVDRVMEAALAQLDRASARSNA